MVVPSLSLLLVLLAIGVARLGVRRLERAATHAAALDPGTTVVMADDLRGAAQELVAAVGALHDARDAAADHHAGQAGDDR